MSGLAQELEPPVPETEIAAAAEQPAAEPSQEAAPEVPAVEGQVEKVEEKPPAADKFVKIQALHEERHKRKASDSRAIEAERKAAVLEDRWNQLMAMQQASQQQQNLPDPNDPLAVMEHNQKLTAQELHNLKQRQAHDDYQRQQHNQQEQLVTWAQSKAAEFAQEAPDFNDAYGFMRQKRHAEFTAMGLDPGRVAQGLHNDELWVFAHAAQTGKNPAQIIYDMAVANGYKKGAAKVTPEQKMQTLQKGVEASKTLGAGGAPAGNPTPEQIADMSESDFADFKAKLAKQGKRLSDAL